jgi:hypothetical protein
VLEERFLVDELTKFCRERNVSEDKIGIMVKNLSGGENNEWEWDLNRAEDVDKFEVHIIFDAPGGELGQRRDDLPDDFQLSAGTWVVSQSQAGRDCTLHKVGSCYRIPGVHYMHYTQLSEEEMTVCRSFNRVCADCYPAGLPEEDNSESDVSSLAAED